MRTTQQQKETHSNDESQIISLSESHNCIKEYY